MMGSQASAQAQLFYSFNLEDHIPSNHLLRGIAFTHRLHTWTRVHHTWTRVDSMTSPKPVAICV